MLTINTNYWNIILRFFSTIIAILCIPVFIRVGQEDPNNMHVIVWKFKAIHMLYFIILVFVFFVFTIVRSLLGIIKVQADDKTGTIIFTTFFLKRIISTGDLENYFVLTHTNAFKEWKGLLLFSKDNKSFQLAGQNLKSIENFEDYLVKKGITCLGERTMKFPFN